MDKQRLQRKKEELEKKWDMLGEILHKLDRQRILETRVDERIRLEDRIKEIETERQQVDKELNDLEAKLLSGKPVIRLRSKLMLFSKEEAQEVFGLDDEWQPREYIENDFEDKGETIIDYATGLMWQKSGSDAPMKYKSAQAYIKGLNQKRFAGYEDWRLPTIPELMSLLEPEEQSNGMYISPIFDRAQMRCWSADIRKVGSAWRVNFDVSNVHWLFLNDNIYVRAVRSWQD